MSPIFHVKHRYLNDCHTNFLYILFNVLLLYYIIYKFILFYLLYIINFYLIPKLFLFYLLLMVWNILFQLVRFQQTTSKYFIMSTSFAFSIQKPTKIRSKKSSKGLKNKINNGINITINTII